MFIYFKNYAKEEEIKSGIKTDRSDNNFELFTHVVMSLIYGSNI
jgi:hypothetical protein